MGVTIRTLTSRSPPLWGQVITVMKRQVANLSRPQDKLSKLDVYYRAHADTGLLGQVNGGKEVCGGMTLQRPTTTQSQLCGVFIASIPSYCQGSWADMFD